MEENKQHFPEDKDAPKEYFPEDIDASKVEHQSFLSDRKLTDLLIFVLIAIATLITVPFSLYIIFSKYF